MTNTSTDISTSSTSSDDPRPLLERALATAIRVVDGVRPDQHHLPTPCDAYDVGALLGHLAFAIDRVAACGRGDQLGLRDELVTSTDWPTDMRAHAAAAVDAWRDDARLDAVVELPWTSMSGDETVRIYINEVTVHTWDLATATGQDVEWDDEVVAVAQAAILRELPTADRSAMWEAFADGMPEGMDFAAPFADARPVGDGAAPIERLVAWSGR